MDSTEKRPLIIARGWIQAAAVVLILAVARLRRIAARKARSRD